MAREIIKKLPNLTHFNDGSIKLTGGRLSYPHFDKPYNGGDNDGEGKYSTKYLMPKETHQAEYEYLAEVCKKTALNANKLTVGKSNYFIKDGDDSGKVEEADMYVVSASENAQPVTRDASAEKVTDKAEIARLMVGGNYANIFIRPWAQNNAYGKKINANLIAGQFVKKGEPFGEGRIDDEDVFEDESTESNFEDDDTDGI